MDELMTQTVDQRCECHGKTEAELAAPYALFAYSLAALPVVAVIFMWVIS